MTWPEIVWVTSSDQGPVPAICPWRWTKPPSHTQCKPPSAGQVTLHLTLLQFGSGWGSAKDILFPWEKVWLSLGSPHWGEWRKYKTTFPFCSTSSFLKRKRGRESALKHLQQQEFTLASFIHISPREESVQRDPGSPCISPAAGFMQRFMAWAQSAQAVMAVGKTALTQGWHCPSTPCSTDVFPTPSPEAESCSSKASQH